MFKIDLTIENSSELQFDCDFASENEVRSTQLLPNADAEISTNVEKIDLHLLEQHNFELNDKIFSKLVNKKLKFQSKFDSNEYFQVDLQFPYLSIYNNIVFKKPFDIIFVENRLINDLLIQNLMGIQFSYDFVEKQDSFFQIKLMDKKGLCIVYRDVFEKIMVFLGLNFLNKNFMLLNFVEVQKE
jgi:hypothetical protein